MKLILLAICLTVFAGTAFGEDQSALNGIDQPLPQDNPFFHNYGLNPSAFDAALDGYRLLRNQGGDVMFDGFWVGLTGFVASSAFTGLSGAGMMDPGVAFWGDVGSYSVLAIGGFAFFWGFFQWLDNSQKYEQTIILAKNYYNMID